MDDQTYGDPVVRELMAKRYIAVMVDQSSRPDISNRYREYDLPTTVIFQANASEILRQQGDLSPKQMASILQAVIDDPSPGPSVTPEPAITYATTPLFSAGLLNALNKAFKSQYDLPAQGWAFGLKYLDADSVEYASMLAGRGDKQQERRMNNTLRDAQQLLDPIWGGVYQSLVVPTTSSGPYPAAEYIRLQIGGFLDSTGDNWNEPHFEKRLYTQAQAMRIYSQSYAQWHNAEYLATAQRVHHFVLNFLTSPDGAFYVSQDADVAGGGDSAAYFALDNTKRRALGIPHIDKHLYARENGWMITALCDLYAVSGDTTALKEAKRSAFWVIANRSLPDGGFSHGEHESGGPYLGDTLAMGQGFLALYEVTGNREWLKRAQAAGNFIELNFSVGSRVGFVTSKIAMDLAYMPHPDRDENAQLARFANLLHYYTGAKKDENVAALAMRYLATREIATAGLPAPELLAEVQFTHPPLRISVVGAKRDAAANALFRAALSTGLAYKQIEWREHEGRPSRLAIPQYPKFAHAVAFVCVAATCSSSITDPQALKTLIAKAEY